MATNELNQNPVVQVSETANKEPNAEMVNLVKIENSQVVTTSVKIAKIFGKSHAHVLRDIKALECSDSFRESNFGLSYIIKQLPNNGSKQLPMYYITRDGFMFLVMGFTGKTAAKWKEAYIKAFNEMEAKIRAEQMAKAIEEHDRKEAIEYEKLLEREEREEAAIDARVAAMPPAKSRKGQAEPQTTEQPATTTEDGIVEVMNGKRVISSRTLARLTGRRHGDVMDSVQRMFKYSSRPSRMFIKSDDWAKKTNCKRANRCYYITVGGFALMCKRTWSISSEVHKQVLAAFGNNTGLSREQLALPQHPKDAKEDRTPTTPPTPTDTAKPQPQQGKPTAAAATMPQTPTDLMQRFVKAMGVMMGMDTDNLMNLMNKGE